MPKEYIESVLGEVAKLTTILINAAKIKDRLDVIKDKDDTVKALNDTKELVKDIHEKSGDIKERFDKKYYEILAKIEEAEKSKAFNGHDSSSVSDTAPSDASGDKANGILKPLIKLVDINKLVEQKSNKDSVTKTPSERSSRQKSVQFNQSVVVISSSEDESTEKSSKKKDEEPPKKVSDAKRKSSIDEEVSSKKVSTKEVSTKGGNKRKRNLLENVRLPSSSESDDLDKEVVVPKNKTKKSSAMTVQKSSAMAVQKKRKIMDVDWEKDVKFKSKSYVDLLRIPCEKMKEYYAEKYEILEVLKLTRTDNLEKIRSDKRDSDKRRTRLQRSKLSLKHAPKKPVDSGSSGDESDDEEPKKTRDTDSDVCDNTFDEHALAEAVLEELSSDGDNDETKLDTDLSGDESGENKKKKKSTGDKKQKKSTKDSSNAEHSDHAKESEDDANRKDRDGKTAKENDIGTNDSSKSEKKAASTDEGNKDENEKTRKSKKVSTDDDKKDSGEDADKPNDPNKNDAIDSEPDEEASKGKDKDTDKDKDKDTDESKDEDSGKSKDEESGKSKDEDSGKSKGKDAGKNKGEDADKSKDKNPGKSKGKGTDQSEDEDTDNSEDSEEEKRKKKKDKENSEWKKDKLLTVTISSSDSESDREKMKKKQRKKESKKSDDESDSDKDREKIKKKKQRKESKTSDDNSGSEKDREKIKKKKKQRKESKTSDDDSDEDDVKSKRRKLVKKKVKKAFVLDSDSDGSKSSKDESDDEKKAKKKSSSSSSESEKEEEKSKNKRKRVKRVKDSSEDDDDKDTRRQIRRVWGRDSLAETTKKAEEEEKERKARIAEKQKKYNSLSLGKERTNATVDKVVLDFDEKTEKELLKVDDDLVKKLKPHQANGVRFMWEACFESLERSSKTPGSGCILAHCMGLGKTLQVIALAHTLLTNFEQTKVKKVMVVSPLNTVLNWVNEFKQWLPDNDDYEVYELVSAKQHYERQYQVKTWHNNGGVLIIGYDMFRNLSNPENKKISKKMRTAFYEALVDPGPDLVICDEGHLLKNEKTNISIAMNRLKTLRRIVLTGTPLQNNLKEYFCMVQFIKPNLLGTYKEYLNRFVNPITNGQYTDSTPHDIQIMRKRSHVLHKMLDGIVQRRDYSVLQPYLPPKHEYVLFLTLSDIQIKLYEHYMKHMAKKSSLTNTSFLFVDFQAFQRICTHPRVLLDKSNEMKAKEKTDDEDESEGSLRDFIDDKDGNTSSSSSSSSGSSNSGSEKSDDEKSKKKKSSTTTRGGRITRAVAATAKENCIDLVGADDDVIAVENKEWWQEYCDGSELDVIAHGSKLFLLFEILKECEQIGDKVLVFSQSLYSLNVIEYFLDKIDSATERGDPDSVGGYSGNWHLGLDYFRLDGSSSCDNRNIWCKSFNNPKNTRARLFLISTRAGGLGINLVAANRVIIFDVSWNPSHDIQSIYRVYRFGQTKPCYIYRFVTYGTMEMKIYERQVTKQAISKRVIDEQQIDRHYNQTDLAELYQFDPKPDDRPIPLVPKDVLLGEMLQKHEDRIFKYHEHQSLLENKEDETLNEEERKAAWEEFESEKVHRQQNRIPNLLSSQALASAMISLVRKDNPTWNDHQIRSVIPALSMKLQAQLSVGDFSMYKQIQAEVQLLNQMQQQKMRMQQLQNQYQFMQQQLNNMQQQEHEASMDMSINPAALYPALYPQVELTQPGTSRTSSNSIIDLND